MLFSDIFSADEKILHSVFVNVSNIYCSICDIYCSRCKILRKFLENIHPIGIGFQLNKSNGRSYTCSGYSLVMLMTLFESSVRVHLMPCK